jgi:acyl-CoA hydrolase
VDVYREDPMGGSREMCAVAFFTMVAQNTEGRPKSIPPETTQDDEPS